MIFENGFVVSFATWLSGKIADKGFDSIYEKLGKKNEFDDKFTRSIKKVSDKLERKYPDLLGNSVSYFFTQASVFDELCKLLFINQNVDSEVIKNSFDDSTLPTGYIIEFIIELKDELSRDQVFYEIIADKELFITVQGISKSVNEISNNSTLSYSEINEIREILERQFRDKFNLDNFKSIYIKNLVNVVGEINFIGLGIDPSIKKGKRKELDSIFVKPYFTLSSKYHIDKEAMYKREYDSNKLNWDSDDRRISFHYLFDRDYNYVILGNPGSGKSLLIKSIILYISNKTKQFSNEDILSYIPFRIELKNYLTYKRNKGGSLLKYLVNVIEEEYSVPNVLEENISSVLTNERAIIFFDGLDEIFNVVDKISIKNDIENFHNIFPKTKSITTSRYIGYNEAKLDEEQFCELHIQPFDLSQIKEYVSNWYLLEEENSEVRNIEVSDFIAKMDIVDRELLSNPLLLSLIVILYRNNLKIPDSKLEIYQSCTNTLVDKWDASKNLEIQIDERILLKKEPIFSDLAFWQYEVLSSSNTEVTYHKVKNLVSQSLIKKRVADEDNSNQLADAFLNYAQKRSIYFENNFTHKTFLEYYTAFWIYSNIELKHDVKERNKIIRQYISNNFWSIVLELLLNMIDKDQPDTDILDGIIRDNITFNDSYSFLVYIIPNLRNVSDEVKELVYYTSIKYLVDFTNPSDEEKIRLDDLYVRLQKNSLIVSQRVLLSKAINDLHVSHKNCRFYVFINELELYTYTDQAPISFNLSSIRNSEDYSNELQKESYLYLIHYWRRPIPDDSFDFFQVFCCYIDLYGVDSLFKSYHSYYDQFYVLGFIHFYLYHQFQKQQIFSIHSNLKILSNLNLCLIDFIRYFISDRFMFSTDSETVQYILDHLKTCKKDQEIVFYIFILNFCFTDFYYTSSSRKLHLESFKITKKRKKELTPLLKERNTNDLLKMIVSLYKMKDREILHELDLIKTKAY